MSKSTRIALMTLAVLAAACGGGGPERQALPDPPNQYFSSLSAIWAFSDQDVWAVGSRVLHFDGAAWTEVAGPGNGIGLNALWGLAPDDLWATSGSRIFRWRGAATGWVELLHNITNPPDFDAIWVRAPDDYAVGGGAVNWEVVRVKGATISRRYTLGAMTSLWGATSDDVWAAAETGFWHWTGTAWSQVVPPGPGTARPHSVWGLATGDVWAAGQQAALHWDGAVWTTTTLDADLNAVWGAAHDDVWAAGDQGSVWHFDGAWSETTTRPSVFFTNLHGSGPRSVWAVGYELGPSGNHGVIYRLQ